MTEPGRAREPGARALEIAALARIAYIVIVAIATLGNLGFDPDPTDVSFRLARALHIAFHMADAVDAARNIVLFAGLGAVWVATSRQPRLRRPLLHGTIAGLVLSTTVEALQLFSPLRFSSINDVASNTIGALLGGLAVIGLVRLVRWERRREPFGGIPVLVIACSYTMAVLAEMATPYFRPPTLPNLGGGVGERIGRALDAVVPIAAHGIPRTEFVLFLPAGMLLAVALIGLGMSRGAAWITTSVLGWLAALSIEILHGVLDIAVDLGAVLGHTLALAVGAAAGAIWFPAIVRAVRRPRAEHVAIGIYAALVAAWSWRPFRLDLSPVDLAEQFSASHVIPLRYMMENTSLLTVTDVLLQACLFFPLGVLLAVEPLGERGWRAGLWPVVLLSLVVELGKIPIAYRSLDITHVLIECGAAGVGWLLVCRPAVVRPGGA